MHTPQVDLFLRSYAGDLQWLVWALRSIAKSVTGIRDIILCVPANDYDKFKAMNFTRELVVSSRLEPFKDDYMGQQADKLLAHLYSDADLFLYWDSDCIAIRNFSPADLMIDGKPRCLETPFDKLLKVDGTPDSPWQPIVERVLGFPVTKERMRAHPMLVPRATLLGFRAYLEALHNMPLGEYINTRPDRQFSEWNCLFSWAAQEQPDLFTFWDTAERGVPEPFVRQFWSWGGITPEIRAEMERILA